MVASHLRCARGSPRGQEEHHVRRFRGLPNLSEINYGSIRARLLGFWFRSCAVGSTDKNSGMSAHVAVHACINVDPIIKIDWMWAFRPCPRPKPNNRIQRRRKVRRTLHSEFGMTRLDDIWVRDRDSSIRKGSRYGAAMDHRIQHSTEGFSRRQHILIVQNPVLNHSVVSQSVPLGSGLGVLQTVKCSQIQR